MPLLVCYYCLQSLDSHRVTVVRVKGVCGPFFGRGLALAAYSRPLSLPGPLWHLEFLVGLQTAQLMTDDSKSVRGFDISIAIGSGECGCHCGLAFSFRLCYQRGKSVHAPIYDMGSNLK